MPAPTVPADDIAILCRTGSRALVHYLLQNPDSYYGDAKDALNLPVSSLTRDLRLLEEKGVVVTDSRQPLGTRRGRSPRYKIDVERVEALLADLRTQLLG